MRCHQNLNSTEKPPAASKHASPKAVASGVFLIRYAIGHSHATPEVDSKFSAKKSISPLIDGTMLYLIGAWWTNLAIFECETDYVLVGFVNLQSWIFASNVATIFLNCGDECDIVHLFCASAKAMEV